MKEGRSRGAGGRRKLQERSSLGEEDWTGSQRAVHASSKVPRTESRVRERQRECEQKQKRR